MIQTNKKYNNLVKGLQKEFCHETVTQGYKKEIEILKEIIDKKNREIKLLRMELKNKGE